MVLPCVAVWHIAMEMAIELDDLLVKHGDFFDGYV